MFNWTISYIKLEKEIGKEKKTIKNKDLIITKRRNKTTEINTKDIFNRLILLIKARNFSYRKKRDATKRINFAIDIDKPAIELPIILRSKRLDKLILPNRSKLLL